MTKQTSNRVALMSYLDDLRELERQNKVVSRLDLIKQYIRARPEEKPDKLAPYRDQRWDRPNIYTGPIEPEIV